MFLSKELKAHDWSRKRAVVLAGSCLLLWLALAVNTAQASTMLQPAGVTTNRTSAGGSNIQHVIDQSGLTANYISGETNLHSFASTTIHQDSNPARWVGADLNMADSMLVDFDLGGTFNIDSFALWNIADEIGVIGHYYGIPQFDMFVADNPGFANASVVLEDQTTHPESIGGYANGEVFDFDSVDASYVRLRMDHLSWSNPCYVSFGEIAFGVSDGSSPVPEPLTAVALLSGCAALGKYIRKRSRQ